MGAIVEVTEVGVGVSEDSAVCVSVAMLSGPDSKFWVTSVWVRARS